MLPPKLESELKKSDIAAGAARANVTCARNAYVFNYAGSPAEFLDQFQNFYGPTMNAFEAAEKNGRAGDLRRELEDLFTSQNTSEDTSRTSIPATFLRVTVDLR